MSSPAVTVLPVVLTALLSSRLDVAEWVRKNAQAAAPDGTPVDDGLQIAGANGTGKAQLTRVSVIMEDDKTDEALRREREKKADAKR